MGRHVYRGVDPPTDSPILVLVGVGLALWGLSLLFAALPALICLPTGPRALRLGALGVSIAAALIGLLQFCESTVLAGTMVSFGFIAGYAISLFVRSVSRATSRDHSYAPVSADDAAEDMELKNKTEGPDRDDAVSQFNSKAGRKALRGEGLALCSSIAFFAVLRSSILGSAVYQYGGRRLETLVVTTVGQICLCAGALSVTLQDAQFEISRSAQLSVLYSLMAPLGLVVGANMIKTPKINVVELEYSLPLPFQLLSAFTAGILLFQTAASKLPLEIRDSDDEWRYKGQDKAYFQTQLKRLGALIGGGVFMAILFWPELVIDLES
mmetsp:Transcript_29938/g.87166  ORF Transcript_29938/g.87166 Transcript_29938/m.87166 type:complete len:325 (-) Transcript_29938:466-1440(-)